jgi:hypothetical protein
MGEKYNQSSSFGKPAFISLPDDSFKNMSLGEYQDSHFLIWF